jgi:hypothetical protein
LTIVNDEIMVCGPMHARHSKKEINEVLDYADDLGLCIVQTKAGHRWGRLECAESHKKSIWSTPASPGNHARDLRKWIEQHAHKSEGGGDE